MFWCPLGTDRGKGSEYCTRTLLLVTIPTYLKFTITVFPHIVSSLEQFPHQMNSKKNSCRGNYMRKYGIRRFCLRQLFKGGNYMRKYGNYQYFSQSLFFQKFRVNLIQLTTTGCHWFGFSAKANPVFLVDHHYFR